LYPTTATSSIGGYNTLVTSITDPVYNTTAVDITTGAITGTDQFIAGLITEPGLIIGNPGVFNMTTIGNIRKTSGSGQAEFYFTVYKRDAAGTETLILQSSNTPQITSAIYTEFNASGLWNDGIFISTDRIVLKFYGTKIGSGSNPTYDFQFGGTAPVRSIVPVPLNVIPVLSLDELTDVTIQSQTNNQVLAYETSTNLWKNKTIVEDAIVNGVIDKAPSQNAVFDALDLTRRLIVSNTGSTVTGTVAETILTSMVVSANTLDTVCDLFITLDYNKNVANPIPMKLYYNTSNSLAGATQISFYNTGSNRNGGFNRKFVVKGTSMDLITTVPTFTQLNNQFIDAIFAASTVITIAPTGNIYFIFTVANDAVGTTFINKRATVEKMKLS